MKADIHPDYHAITVRTASGEEVETFSTYGKKGDVLVLDVDWKKHPAWTGGGALLNKSVGQVAKFNDKFSALGSFGLDDDDE